MSVEMFLLPDGEIADGVRALLPNVAFCTRAQAEATKDLSAVEFYVPPYFEPAASLAMLGRLPNVRVVQLLTAGVDWITSTMPANAVLCNARGVHEDSTSELTLAGILAMMKHIPRFVRFQENLTWAHQRVQGLAGRRAVVLGYGAIGRAVGSRLEAFGVEVQGVTSSGRDGTMRLSAMDGALALCSILVITLPLTPQTAGIVDSRLLAKLPDGALVVSVGRGPSLDQSALESELVSGRLSSFLDVSDPEPLPPDSPLWRLPNVLITPHVGGDSEAFPRLASRLVARQMSQYLAGGPLEHQIVGQY